MASQFIRKRIKVSNNFKRKILAYLLQDVYNLGNCSNECRDS